MIANKIPYEDGDALGGSAINVINYTSSNPYKTEHDGYFQLYARTSGRFLLGAVRIPSGVVSYFGAINAAGTSYNSIYVPKGAEIYLESKDDTGGFATFHPIITR